MIRFFLCFCLLLSLQAVSSSDCPCPGPAEFNFTQQVNTSYFHLLNWKFNPLFSNLAYAGTAQQQTYNKSAPIQHWVFRQVLYQNKIVYIIWNRETSNAIYTKGGAIYIQGGLYLTSDPGYANQLWTVTQHKTYSNVFYIRSVANPSLYLTASDSSVPGATWALVSSSTDPAPTVGIQIAAPMIPDFNSTRVTIARAYFNDVLLDCDGDQINRNTNPGNKVLWDLIPTTEAGPGAYRLKSVENGYCLNYYYINSNTDRIGVGNCGGGGGYNQHWRFSPDPQFNGLMYTVDNAVQKRSLTGLSNTASRDSFLLQQLTSSTAQRFKITFV